MEKEKRLHRCCFSGQRPEKLEISENEIKKWIGLQVDDAVASGYCTFICGMGMGVDLWAGETVLKKRAQNPALRLICVVPWPGFSNRWDVGWKTLYSEVLRSADLVVPIAHQYRQEVFWRRNTWMVDHASRLIAYYNGEPGGTRDMVEYARRQGIEVITNHPVLKEKRGKLRESGKAVVYDEYGDEKPAGKRKVSDAVPAGGVYPKNLASAVLGKETDQPLNPDQVRGLEHILGMLMERERGILLLRYREGKSLAECGKQYGFSKQRAQQIEARALKKLHYPSRAVFVRDGFEKTELALKIACAEEMKRCLAEQKVRYPRMNEEDVVKFAFQGMLGVGHLVSSEEDALSRLREEMDRLEPNMEEPLAEKISTYWLRINLRAAKARDMSAEDLAYRLFRSAQMRPLSFTRQNVYNFCVKLDGSEKMKEAAARVLDESWLPRHSQVYRETYAPAYRVMYRDYRKFSRDEEEK